MEHMLEIMLELANVNKLEKPESQFLKIKLGMKCGDPLSGMIVLTYCTCLKTSVTFY